METKNKIKINKSAADVWKVLADDFSKADQWMSVVYKSYAHPTGVGRVCEFTTKEGGFRANELITNRDDGNMKMTVEIEPIEAPGALPIRGNTLNFQVSAINDHESEVFWNSSPQLKVHGKLLQPILKIGLTKAFSDILEELKYFLETGEQHPRKLKNVKKLAVARA